MGQVADLRRPCWDGAMWECSLAVPWLAWWSLSGGRREQADIFNDASVFDRPTALRADIDRLEIDVSAGSGDDVPVEHGLSILLEIAPRDRSFISRSAIGLVSLIVGLVEGSLTNADNEGYSEITPGPTRDEIERRFQAVEDAIISARGYYTGAIPSFYRRGVYATFGPWDGSRHEVGFDRDAETDAVIHVFPMKYVADDDYSWPLAYIVDDALSESCDGPEGPERKAWLTAIAGHLRRQAERIDAAIAGT